MLKSVRVYVGSLPYSATDEDLRELFQNEQFAVKEICIECEADGITSRGFGFVTLQTEKSIEAILTQMSGKRINGRLMIVGKPRQKEMYSPGARPGAR